MKIKFIITDDEPLARKLIQSHASKIDDLEEIGVFSNAIDTLNFLRESEVDLAFLDIQMPELNGLEIIKSLRHPPTIILTTAYREFAADAYELEVLDYLVKPISFDRFSRSIEKYRAGIQKSEMPIEKNKETVIHLKANRKHFPIRPSEIFYVESLDNYVKVHLRERIVITHETISSLESRLQPDLFVRIHRSYLVNRIHIQSISSESIVVNNKELNFGRAFKQLALTRLGLS